MDEKCKGTDARTEWYSILVTTDVYQTGTEPRYKPTRLVDMMLCSLDAANHENGGR